MELFYNLIIIIFMLFSLPLYLFKGKFHRGFIRRFGIIPKEIKFNRPIWVHAVSVGEAIVMRGLIEELRRIYPLKNFVISTVTPTGNKIACSMARESDFVTYLPFDLSFITEKVIRKVKPSIFIIAETEIWPNLINTLYKAKIPVAILNARISDASFMGYKRIKYLIKPVLGKVAIFCTQSQRDAFRLISLGAIPEKIEVTGNMKFDQIQGLSYGIKECKSRLGLKEEECLLVAGSTHQQEEDVVLSAYSKLLKVLPGLRLLLAPRHPERAESVCNLIKRLGFSPQRISSYSPDMITKNTVFVLDTVGDLSKFYLAADIVFVGGSLVRKGGHNILEPASLGKPVIFGPHMFNFRDIASEFLNTKAAIQIFNQDDLIFRIRELLEDKTKREKLAGNAREVILRNQGATKRNTSLLGKLIV